MQRPCKASPCIGSAKGLQARHSNTTSNVLSAFRFSLYAQPLLLALLLSLSTRLRSQSCCQSPNVIHTTILRLDPPSQTNVDLAVDNTTPIQVKGQSASPRHPVLPDAPIHEPTITNDAMTVPLAPLGDSATSSLRNGSNVLASQSTTPYGG